MDDVVRKACSLFLGAMVLAFLPGCDKKTGASAESGPASLDADTSYAVGMFVAAQFPWKHYDYKAFVEGFKAVAENEKTRFTNEEAQEKLESAIYAMAELENTELGEENSQKGTAFLEENRKKAGIMTTGSGLQYEVISEGSGEKPAAADKVRVNYEGTLLDGTVFDSSYARGEPAEFPLNGVISGWTEGLQLMSPGSTYKFYIPANLAYGNRRMGDSIPPNSTLIFKVELLEVLK
jgi:FKBP-type peptidyl-prolyl cis-trans isomerase